MRPDDLPRLRAKAADRGARQLWQRVTNRADEDPVVQAFMHHIEQNSSYCDSAVAAQRARVASTLAKRPPNGGRLPDHDLSSVGRTFFSILHTTSVVLDWCYDTLNPDARAFFISGIKALANMDAPGYPIDFGNATSPPHWDTVVGHPCEGWVMTGQLPGGIAMYDDDPSMYEGAARYFFEGLLPVRQLAYNALKHYEGTHYTYARYEHEIASAMIWSAIGQPDVFPPSQPAIMSEFIYSLIPNGVSAVCLSGAAPLSGTVSRRISEPEACADDGGVRGLRGEPGRDDAGREGPCNEKFPPSQNAHPASWSSGMILASGAGDVHDDGVRTLRQSHRTEGRGGPAGALAMDGGQPGQGRRRGQLGFGLQAGADGRAQLHSRRIGHPGVHEH